MSIYPSTVLASPARRTASLAGAVSVGSLIVVEGPNYSGKSTLVAELDRELRRIGHRVAVVREPGGTPFGEGIRSVVKDPGRPAGAFASALAFEAARAHLIKTVILPLMADGKVVLCDRYFMSTEIFQGKLSPDLTDREREILQDIHAQFPVPDLTVFLLISQGALEFRSQGARGGETDRFEGIAQERAAYVDYARKEYSHEKLIVGAPVPARQLVQSPAFLKALPQVDPSRQGWH
jgi:dTMP kinase